MTQKSFHDNAKRFVKKVIAIRRVIISERKNQLDQAESVIERLESLLKYWPYNTNRKMALFLKNHRCDILYLIPGQNSRSHQSIMAQFNELLEKSKHLLRHESETVC